VFIVRFLQTKNTMCGQNSFSSVTSGSIYNYHSAFKGVAVGNKILPQVLLEVCTINV